MLRRKIMTFYICIDFNWHNNYYRRFYKRTTQTAGLKWLKNNLEWIIAKHNQDKDRRSVLYERREINHAHRRCVVILVPSHASASERRFLRAFFLESYKSLLRHVMLDRMSHSLWILSRDKTPHTDNTTVKR